MQITLHGQHDMDEAADSIVSILKLFQERYGIDNFREINLTLTLIDGEGQDVELVDAQTCEVLGVFEVYKSGEYRELQTKHHHSKLRLVVDNTKKKQEKK